MQGAKDLQHIQYRELGKGMQVWECRFEGHKGLERLLRSVRKAMNMKEELTELFGQGPRDPCRRVEKSNLCRRVW